MKGCSPLLTVCFDNTVFSCINVAYSHYRKKNNILFFFGKLIQPVAYINEVRHKNIYNARQLALLNCSSIPPRNKCLSKGADYFRSKYDILFLHLKIFFFFFFRKAEPMTNQPQTMFATGAMTSSVYFIIRSCNHTTRSAVA